MFEGMAIMLYLCEKYDKDYKLSYPFDTDRYVHPLLIQTSLLLRVFKIAWNIS